MIDIKWIRDNTEKFNNAMLSRNINLNVQEILLLDEEKRKKIFFIQELQSKRNKIAKDIAEIKRNNGNVEPFLEESKQINQLLHQAENNFEVEEK